MAGKRKCWPRKKTVGYRANPISCLPMPDMTVLQEREVREQLRNSAVKEIHVKRGEKNQYEVYLVLTWAKEPAAFFTQRHSIRTWASLDRLVTHFEGIGFPVPPIVIHLESSNDEHSVSSPEPPG